MSFITLFPEEEPEKKKSFNLKPEMMKVWLAVKQASGGFSGALFLSGLIHLIIGVVLSVTAVSYYSYPGSSGSQPAVDSDFKLLARAVEEAPSLDDPALIARLRAEGVTHVFVGERAGRLLPKDLDASPHYRLLYTHGPARVYAFAP